MDSLSVPERQLLLIFHEAKQRGEASDLLTLQRLWQRRIASSPDWENNLRSLSDRGLLCQQGGSYHLTLEGEARAGIEDEAHPLWLYSYDDYYTRASMSQAHSRFCEQVYGMDLCQHGLADMDQVNALIGALALDETHRVLDLGCGNGFITEYIANTTGAFLTGVDVSEAGIGQALARTTHRRDRIDFKVADIHHLNLPAASFDSAILIDIMYFLIHATALNQLLGALRPGGQMGILFTQWLRPGDSEDILHPEHTKLAQSLRAQGLHFECQDFSASESLHWQRKFESLHALQSAFEAEGNLWLYHFRLGEAENHLQSMTRQPRSRTLYHVWLPS